MFIYLHGRRIWTELNEADSGGNSGGGESTTANAVEAAFKRLLEKNGSDPTRVAEKLFDENYQYRKQIRQLEQQVAEVQGKVPADGAVVLSGDDATTWQAYQALGKPDEVKQGLEERAKLQGDLAAKDRQLLLRTVAETVGYKPSVLTNLDRIAQVEGKALSFEIRDTQVDGKPVKMAYVKEGDKESPITDYAATNWADFMPVLSAQAEQQSQGTRHVTQHAGNSGGGKPDAVAEFLQRQERARAAVKNPLLKE